MALLKLLCCAEVISFPHEKANNILENITSDYLANPVNQPSSSDSRGKIDTIAFEVIIYKRSTIPYNIRVKILMD